MSIYYKFFICKNCGGKHFIKINQFGVTFQEVNFSDELMYDEVDIEEYRCIDCNTLYSLRDIKEGTKEIIRKYKSDYWEKEIG